MASQMTQFTSTSHRTLSSSELLHEELDGARVEYPEETHRFFIPESSKKEILTKDVIMTELEVSHQGIDEAVANDRANVVFERAKNLFGILAYMKKGGEVWALIEEGISDADLPFERCQGEADPFSLRRKSGEKVLQQWERKERETFSREQWCMLAPVFEDKKHHVLHKNTVLPFITIDSGRGEQGSLSGGGYSEVFTTRIHNAHHMFSDYWTAEVSYSTTLAIFYITKIWIKDPHLKVAIKRLFTKKRDDFENEQSILIQLGNKTIPHPHLVKLLATYECNGDFFLIFPCANCNLRNYWEERPTPQFDQEVVSWSLDQMRGIAQALNTVHNFKVTHPRTADVNDRTPPVEQGEELFGRHGDIKPENIIWYERIPKHDNGGRGFLQITDFGLGRFHGRDSRTGDWTLATAGSMTYEPPDCILRRPARRAYDLWSLGCLYIEFATWLLKGNEEIEGFSDRRGRQSSIDPHFNDDHFFTIIKDESDQPYDATVREGVREWVNDLHNDQRCSKFIHDLLDLVMEDLLVIEATHRAEASSLCTSFNEFLSKSKEDKDYLCAPAPRPQEQSP